MFNVSDAYKLAVADSHRKSKMRAVLTVGSTVINIDDSDIIKDSVYVTNQCTNGNEYEYGCTYAAECGIAIKSAVDRYALYDAKLELYWSLWVGADWEEIPLGVFYVSEPNRINDKISIKALDGMTKLDAYVTEDTQGTMPELMAYIADKCGVELAQTADELSTFINAEIQLSVQEDKVDSYRDLLSYLGMLTASFAVFDRYGKLRLVQYATEHCVELGRKQRFTNASFSDYTTSFVGVKARFIAEENYAPYEAGEDGNGLVLDMGDIPILRGLPETKNAVLDTVYVVLKNVSYTPFEIETLGNPALDLGDYVKNIGVGRNGKTYISPITYYYWTYRGKHKLRAVGGNPKLANVTKYREKYTKSLESTIETKTVVVKEFRNADAISFSDKPTEIARLNFAATEKSKPIFLLCVRMAVDLDGVLALQFCMDGIADETRLYRQYLERGEHYITIADVYNVDTNDRHTVNVLANMEYFESDTRKQAADVQTNKNFLGALAETGATVVDNVVQFPTYDVAEVDTTVASATIKQGEVCAILYGQGVAGEGKWDGTLQFIEDFAPLSFTSISFANVAESLTCNTQIPTPISFTESFGERLFTSFTMCGLNDSVKTGEILRFYDFSTLYADNYTVDERITTERGLFELKTSYVYESAEQTIDSGRMCVVSIGGDIEKESVVITNG